MKTEDSIGKFVKMKAILSDATPLVSVVVVCFNHEKYVEQCIDTIFSQTYQNIEVFVIDNGSSDGSITNIESSRYFGRFVFIKNKGSKLTPSLNNVIKILRGRYYAFTAADDYHKPTRIINQVKVMEEDPSVGACSGHIIVVDSEGKEERRQHRMKSERFISHEDLLLRNYFFPAPAAMLRAEALHEVCGYCEETQLEDYYLWLRLTTTKWTLKYIGETLSFYRRHGNNLSKNYKLVFEDKISLIEKFGCVKLKSKALIKAHCDQFKILAKTNWKDAIYFILSNFSFNWLCNGSFYNGCFRLIIPKVILDFLGVER